MNLQDVDTVLGLLDRCAARRTQAERKFQTGDEHYPAMLKSDAALAAAQEYAPDDKTARLMRVVQLRASDRIRVVGDGYGGRAVQLARRDGVNEAMRNVEIRLLRAALRKAGHHETEV